MAFLGPRFQHDCDSCVWHGPIYRGDDYADLYFCPKGRTTVILRTGNEPHEYESHPPIAIEGATHE